MNDRKKSKQDIVDRAVDALRNTEISQGPPPDVLEAVVAAGNSPAKQTRKTIRERIFPMHRITRIAAAVILIAGITTLVALLSRGNGTATIAWADVQEQIRNVRTLTFKMSMSMEHMPNMEMDMMFMEPGRMRQELTIGPERAVTIMDIHQDKMISLAEKEKRAFIFNLSNLPEQIRKEHEEQDFLAGIKEMIEEAETELGEREINGRLTKGYRVKKENQVFTIWADAATAYPVEMEMTIFQGETEITMSDFAVDVELDESLFSLDIPEGYTVEEQKMEIREASCEDLVEMLRIWIKARGGTFPDALTPGHFVKDCKDIEHGKSEEQGLEKSDGLEVAQGITRAIVLLSQHPEAHYAGKGVALGEADKPVFWFKPTDSEIYKVIYGDLRIEDVAEEDLPARAADPVAAE